MRNVLGEPYAGLDLSPWARCLWLYEEGDRAPARSEQRRAAYAAAAEEQRECERLAANRHAARRRRRAKWPRPVTADW